MDESLVADGALVGRHRRGRRRRRSAARARRRERGRSARAPCPGQGPRWRRPARGAEPVQASDSPRAIGPAVPGPSLVSVADTLQAALPGSLKSQLHVTSIAVGGRPAPPTTPLKLPLECFSAGIELVQALVEVRAGEGRHGGLADRDLPAAVPGARRPQQHRDVAAAVCGEDPQPLRVGPAHELPVADAGEAERDAVAACPAAAGPAQRDASARRRRAGAGHGAAGWPGARAGWRRHRPARGRPAAARRRARARRPAASSAPAAAPWRT